MEWIVSKVKFGPQKYKQACLHFLASKCPLLELAYIVNQTRQHT